VAECVPRWGVPLQRTPPRRHTLFASGTASRAAAPLATLPLASLPPRPPTTTTTTLRSCCTAHASISGCASFSTGWHSTLLPSPAKIPPTLTFVPSFQPCLATLHRGWAARERAPRICGYGFATDFVQVTKPRRGCEPRSSNFCQMAPMTQWGSQPGCRLCLRELFAACSRALPPSRSPPEPSPCSHTHIHLIPGDGWLRPGVFNLLWRATSGDVRSRWLGSAWGRGGGRTT
jgi:hypothetical protein